MAKPGKQRLKQISVIRVLLLSIITVGIYTIVWLALRRRELAKPQPRLTHWGWYIGMGVIGVTTMFTLLTIALVLISDASVAAHTAVWGSLSIGALMTAWSVWWIVRNIRAINAELGFKPNLFLVTISALFFFPALILYEQYAINRRTRLKSQKSQLSGLLIRVATVSAVIGLLLQASSFAVSPIDQQIESFKRDHAEFQIELKKYQEYYACLDKLNKDYPDEEISNEDYDDYRKASDNCDALYKKLPNL